MRVHDAGGEAGSCIEPALAHSSADNADVVTQCMLFSPLMRFSNASERHLRSVRDKSVSDHAAEKHLRHMLSTSSTLTNDLHASTSYEDIMSAATSYLDDATMSCICSDDAASAVMYLSGSFAGMWLQTSLNLASTVHDVMFHPEVGAMSVDHPQIALCQTQPEFLKLRSMITLHYNYRDMHAQFDVSRSKHISVTDSSNTSNLGYGSYDEYNLDPSSDITHDLSKMNFHDAGCAKDYLAADARGVALVQPYITGVGDDDDAQGVTLVQPYINDAGIAAGVRGIAADAHP